MQNMNLYLDTSTEICRLKLDHKEYLWRFGKNLAEGLHEFIHSKLAENHKTWHDIKKITFYSGPGSFTGLRIGAAVVNTLADQLQIPLYDHHGKKHPIIIPDYGKPANITPPKK